MYMLFTYIDTHIHVIITNTLNTRFVLLAAEIYQVHAGAAFFSVLLGFEGSSTRLPHAPQH